ncbi:GNAT family N-acetyltransferase [Streptomyces sp. NBC_01387]|uniref:GNAT family N-acetyltransferase n=1 Tax=unclassified Streptomyces TaxID=2593676 RepID=UPI002024850A|nr:MULTISPECIES: GNAT family N-acetyltransferase [unclassified Streptomyces]MCX4550421.1 GNAT family N-acetyltransferase [Streptomyces sp. NBC_01500]WSC21875.1 GNAT family N-acetyltransferase [Streptomyces sp. NBC_01766]WSV55830.1 GNAT family N-acetyltransferase [Streptomyces sp. NBC_01014]
MPSLVAPAIPTGSLAATSQPVLPVARDVLLRPWQLTDAEAVREAYQDPEIQRWHARSMDSVDEAREWIANCRRGWQDETGLHWAVADAGSDVLLGRISLRDLVLVDGQAEVAYWMAPAGRGRGACTAAVVELSRWALEEGGFHRLQLDHSTTNEASCRVAIKAGFAAEGTRRGAVLHTDGHHDMHLHARIRGDGLAAGA